MIWQSDHNDKKGGPTLPFFAAALETWYPRHHRDLPWRKTTNPYYIWLSEVILQQTRVAQGLPYYNRFITAYPTLSDLARAPEQELLRLWQGLGYYSRARNLHQTAKFIQNTLDGQFPGTYAALLTLKGVGAYTAAAVASFAFGERVAVVDGNVYRVLARVFGISDDITTPTAKKTFATLASHLIAYARDPATYNQAIMEFGAIQCTPTAPDCLLCPLQQQCSAYQTGQQKNLPVKKKKAAVRPRYFTYLVFRQGTGPTLRLALRQRTGRDIWQGLFDFYALETPKPALAWPPTQLPREVNELVGQGVFPGPPTTGQQLLSHQRIEAGFYQIDVPEGLPNTLPMGFGWYSPEQVSQLPKPVLITTYLARQFGLTGVI